MKKAAFYFLITVISLASCKNDRQQKIITQQNGKTMATADFTTAFVVDQTPEEVFNAVNNVRGWWSEEIEGNTGKLNDEFALLIKAREPTISNHHNLNSTFKLILALNCY